MSDALEELRADDATDASLASSACDLAAWERALSTARPLPSVRSLALPRRRWTRAHFARIAAVFPALRALSCAVDARAIDAVCVEFSALESLSIALRTSPSQPLVRLEGALPALRALRWTHPFDAPAAVDAASLGALVASARDTLEHAHIEGARAWELALALAPSARPGTRWTVRDAESADRDRATTCARSLRAMDHRLDPESCLAILDDPAHIDAFAHELAQLETAALDARSQRVFFDDPARFAALARSRSLRIFDAQGCTTERLEGLLRAMPWLRSLAMINNHHDAMLALRVQSATLESLELTHFHRLQRWHIDAPSLIELSLDNCDGEDSASLGERCGAGEDTVYGDFGERLCAAILDGDPAARVPALRALSVAYNPVTVGELRAIEARRVTIECATGHPALESLRVRNAAHLRALRLQNVPRMRHVSVTQSDDAGPDRTWLARVALDALPAGCEVELCALSPSRVGLDAP